MVMTYSKAKDGKTKITDNFIVSEFACSDGSDRILLDDDLPRILQRIRGIAGNKPLKIASAYRTEAYNAKIKGAPNSYHMRGMAADIKIPGVAPFDVCRCAETALAELKIKGGICLYTKDAFVHVDVRTVRWRGQNDGAGEKNVSGWAPMPVTGVSATIPPDTKKYTVRITRGPVNIRLGPGTGFMTNGQAKIGDVHAIIEESSGVGASLWGRLENGAGWIALDYSVKEG